MTDKTRDLIVVIALALAALDTGARVLIGKRLEGSIGTALLALPVVFLLVLLVLSASERARPGALRIAVPMVALATIGDIVAARLAFGRESAEALLLNPAFCAAGVFVVTLAVVADIARLERIGRLLGGAGLLLIALPLVPGLGVTIGDQSAWIVVGELQVTPGELGRPLVLLGFAASLSRLPMTFRETRSWHEVAPMVRRAAVMPGIAVVLHVLEHDLGVALLLGLALAGTFATATGKLRWFAAALASAGAAMAAAATVSTRLQGRILDAVHPLRLVDGGYDQAGLAHLALAWGGWPGVGFGAGLTDRTGAVPVASTDYALAQWTLEAGLVGLIVTMGLFAWLVATAWTWAMRAPEGFPLLASSGLTWLLTISTVWTTSAVLGFLPLSGLPSPFLAGGASNAVAMAMVVGLLCRTRPGAFGGGVSARGPSALRLGRAIMIATLGVATALTAHEVSGHREELNRRVDNPIRMWSSLRRGTITSRDGEKLAYTVGGGSLDTIDRRYRERKLTGGVVGRTTFAAQDGGGIENAWRAVLRCGGSGQAVPEGRAWSSGATVVVGDPAHCETASLQTSLDLPLQRAALAALERNRGAIVVLDARTGGVLAAVGRLRGDRAVGSLAALDLALAPGSTFKIVTAAAALDAGIPTYTPPATGFAPPGGRRIANAGSELCGGTLEQAFAHSCNNSFASLGMDVGRQRLLATAARLGFGRGGAVSGIPAATGSVGSGDAGDILAASSIGQGPVTATPLQVALMAAAIANDGRRAAPTLVDGVCGAGAVEPFAEPVMRPEVARTLRRAMRATTLQGTGRGAAQAPGEWALKTGTSEVPALREAGTPAGSAAWIVGFPTVPAGSGVIPVIAGVVLPEPAQPQRSGPQEGVAIINAVARAALAAHGPRDACE